MFANYLCPRGLGFEQNFRRKTSGLSFPLSQGITTNTSLQLLNTYWRVVIRLTQPAHYILFHNLCLSFYRASRKLIL